MFSRRACLFACLLFCAVRDLGCVVLRSATAGSERSVSSVPKSDLSERPAWNKCTVTEAEEKARCAVQRNIKRTAVQRAARSMQHKTHTVQHAACNAHCATCTMQRTPCTMQRTPCNVQPRFTCRHGPVQPPTCAERCAADPIVGARHCCARGMRHAACKRWRIHRRPRVRWGTVKTSRGVPWVLTLVLRCRRRKSHGTQSTAFYIAEAPRPFPKKRPESPDRASTCAAPA